MGGERREIPILSNIALLLLDLFPRGGDAIAQSAAAHQSPRYCVGGHEPTQSHERSVPCNGQFLNYIYRWWSWLFDNSLNKERAPGQAPKLLEPKGNPKTLTGLSAWECSENVSNPLQPVQHLVVTDAAQRSRRVKGEVHKGGRADPNANTRCELHLFCPDW